MNEKMEKMKLIQELGFVLTELGLYLNSHPDSSEALARFESTRGLYVNAKNEYEMCIIDRYRNENHNRCRDNGAVVFSERISILGSGCS